MTKNVFVLFGASGSTKSTLAKRLYSVGFSTGQSVICSADHYFERSGSYQFNPAELGAAHKSCRDNFLDALKKSISTIIVDNTNTTLKEMDYYCFGAYVHGYNLYILEPQTSWKYDAAECAARNTHGVPEDKCKQMIDRIKKNGNAEDRVKHYKKLLNYDMIYSQWL